MTFVTSLQREQADGGTLLWRLHDHWVIENKVHRVRDGGYAEGQGHGRHIGQVRAWARNVAISLIWHHGIHYVRDAWRIASAQPQLTLRWLLQVETWKSPAGDFQGLTRLTARNIVGLPSSQPQ